MELNDATRQTIDHHFGTEDALDAADALVVGMILDHLRRLPAVNRRTEIALTAIASLSEHAPDLARALMVELDEATF